MHVTLFVPAPFSTVSGGYAYDRRMVDFLREAGHAVEVAELAGQHPLADDASRDAAAVAWAALPPHTRPLIDGLCLPAFAPLADTLGARGAVGLIHHPTAIETGFDEAARARLRGLETTLLPLLRRVIVTSKPTADQLAADFGVAAARVAIVLPGTEDAPRSTGSDSPTCNLLSVATLLPRKGFDVLLRALARLTDLDWTLTIVGSTDRDPTHARTLLALAESLGIAQRARFAGELTDAALEAEWRRADVFALATYWEGYGMAVAEALKRGLPIAITAGGAAADLVSVATGVIATPGDHAALSLALRRLIFDRELRGEMAAAAWHAGQNLPSWREQARQFAGALA